MLRTKDGSHRMTLFLVLGLACACFSPPVVASVADCIDATCRITTPDGSRGTGCVFEISQGQVYVLTAAHVVGKHAMVTCEFWRDGHQSSPLTGRVIARVDRPLTDAAIVAVDVAQFGGRLPAAIPIAPAGTVLKSGDTLTSVGCARGAWSSGWKGHVLEYQGTDLLFVPAPADGRSGSAIFDAAGEKIVGIIRARTLDNETGIATGLQALYAEFRTAYGEQRSPCDPAACPGGICPIRKPQPQASPWPTLPTPVPPVDLGPTNQRLDQISLQIQTAQTKPAEPVKKEDGPNPAVIGVLILAALAVGGAVFFATQQHTG